MKSILNRIKKLEEGKPMNTSNSMVEDMTDAQLNAVIMACSFDPSILSREELAFYRRYKEKSRGPFTEDEERIIESIVDKIVAAAGAGASSPT